MIGDAVKSTLRFSWAMSLLGARRLGALALGEPPARPAAEEIDDLSHAAERQLGREIERDLARGDRWHWISLDQALGSGPTSTTSRELLRGVLGFVQESAATLRVMLPATEVSDAFQELQNKFEVFELFQDPEIALRLDASETAAGLQQKIERTERLGPYRSLWVLEGLGFAEVESFWNSTGMPPRTLLTATELDTVPQRFWIPLHTGMGLALGLKMLPEIVPRGPGSEDRAALRELVDLCESNSRPGYAEATFEALGLIVRTLEPRAVPGVHEHLRQCAAGWVPTFWHGVGRGLYFALSQTLPGRESTRQALEKVRREPPDEMTRMNAVAGLVWAVALINLRHPRIFEGFLRHHGASLTPAEEVAVANGVSSAATLWYDANGFDGQLEAFCRHRPDPSHQETVERWRRLVAEAWETALERYQEIIDGDGPGSLFSYVAGGRAV